MAPKSPQDKKALDYKHQKRTNWDSDKAARKAIPAAKRRNNKEVRKAAQQLLHEARKVSPLGVDELDEIASNRLVARPTRTTKQKGNSPLSLKENIEQQRKRREQGKQQYSVSTGIYRLTPELVAQQCSGDLATQLIGFMQRMEVNRTGQGTTGRASLHIFAERLDELAQFENTPLIQAFWVKEPGWKKKFEYWVDWRERHMQDS